MAKQRNPYSSQPSVVASGEMWGVQGSGSPLGNPGARDVAGGSMGRLQGKTAIITGATGGIGEATARLFLHESANVMLVGRSAEKLQTVRDRLPSGANVACSVADAADEAATQAMVAATIDAFGGVDILFANAGVVMVNPIMSTSLSDFEEVIRTNIVGVWLAIKHCIEPMKQRGGGAIVATASNLGVVAVPGLASYVASKHAVCGLVKTAALELAAMGIRVNAIAPGPIDNEMMGKVASLVAPEDPGGLRKTFEAGIPMDKYGTNEEVAKFVAFLASGDSSHCTGGIYLIDGGHAAA